MYATSVYGLKLLVLEGGGGKALATDHRERYLFKDHNYGDIISAN